MLGALRVALLALLALGAGALAPGDADVEAAVAAMYSEFPFPSPDTVPVGMHGRVPPQSDGFVGPSYAAEITHHVFGGSRQWLSSSPRVLVAGGGTGMMTLPFALELQRYAPGSRITFLDLTPASLDQARQRWAAAGVTNAAFVQGSLLDPAAVASGGPYDYIDCTGVLHHTPDPPRALANLAASLKPLGGMGLMVYGAVGRAPVYHMRRLLASLAPAEDLGRSVDRLWSLLEELPDSNPVSRSGLGSAEGGRSPASDVSLVDTFLHPQDVAYDVRQVHELVEGAGLRVASFLRPGEYDPAALLVNQTLVAELKQLPLLQQQTFAELFSCTASLHEFYVVKADNPVRAPQPERLSDRVISRTDAAKAVQFITLLREAQAAGKVGVTMRVQGNVLGAVGEPGLASNIILLVDQARERGEAASAGELWRDLSAAYEAQGVEAPTWPTFLASLQAVFRLHNNAGYWFLQSTTQ